MDQHDDSESEVAPLHRGPPLHRGSEGDNAPGFYGLGVNQSTASIFEDVEMAHDEVRPDCNARVVAIANI